MTVSLVGGVRHPKIYVYTIDQFASTPWKGKRKGAIVPDPEIVFPYSYAAIESGLIAP